MHYLKCQALSVRACTFCVITVLIFRVLTCRRDIPVLLNIIISTLLSLKDVNHAGWFLLTM